MIRKIMSPAVREIVQVFYFYTLDKNLILFSSVSLFPYKFLNVMKLTWVQILLQPPN